MPISDDGDFNGLIDRLSGPLASDVRSAFRVAAEAALAAVPCLGEGAAYRALILVQKSYFDPPSDTRDIHHTVRASKLRAEPPLKFGRDRPYTRRQHLRSAG